MKKPIALAESACEPVVAFSVSSPSPVTGIKFTSKYPPVNGPLPIVVRLPFRLVNSANAREHFRVRAKRAANERAVTRMAVSARLHGVVIATSWVVTLTRLYTKKRMDTDGAVNCQKAIRDAVADALGVDDGSNLVEWRYDQRREPKYGVEIRLEAQ